MKKTKKFAAVLLCIAMLLGMSVIPASAINVGDEIRHEITYEDGETSINYYTYEGTFELGVNEIEERYDNQAFIFTAEESGYYFTYSDDSSYHFAAEYSNGVAKNYLKTNGLLNDEDDYCHLNYLEAGDYLVLVANVGDTSYVDFEIEFLGDIIDVTLSGDFISEDYYINDYDIYLYDRDDKCYVSFMEYFIDVEFSNGKVYNGPSYSLGDLYLKDEFANGENTVIFDILGQFTKEYTFEIYEIDYLVKSIEVENFEDYCYIKEYYNGDWYSVNNFGETPVKVSVEFTDGSKDTFDYYYNQEEDIYNTYATFPDGKKCHVWDNYDYEDGVFYFEIRMANKIYLEAECEVIEADFSENSDYLKNNISEATDTLKSFMRYHFNSIPEAYDFEDLMYHIESLFIAPIDKISYIFDEISLFISTAF